MRLTRYLGQFWLASATCSARSSARGPVPPACLVAVARSPPGCPPLSLPCGLSLQRDVVCFVVLAPSLTPWLSPFLTAWLLFLSDAATRRRRRPSGTYLEVMHMLNLSARAQGGGIVPNGSPTVARGVRPRRSWPSSPEARPGRARQPRRSKCARPPRGPSSGRWRPRSDGAGLQRAAGWPGGHRGRHGRHGPAPPPPPASQNVHAFRRHLAKDVCECHGLLGGKLVLSNGGVNWGVNWGLIGG